MPPGVPSPEDWSDRTVDPVGLARRVIRIQAAHRPLLVAGIGVARTAWTASWWRWPSTSAARSSSPNR